MSYEYLLKDSAVVTRLTTTDTNKKTWSTTVATISCYLEPLDAEAAAMNNIETGQGYRIFVASDADVIVSDKLTINAIVYYVRGIQSFSQGRLNVKALVVTTEAT